jgi:hypothetical protein
MRRLSCLCLLILLLPAVIFVGCVQPLTTPPAPTIVPTIATPLPTVTTANLPKNLTFDIAKSVKTVNITYTGGPDAADLLALDILINNQDGSKIKQNIVEPVIGFPYVYMYMGYANPVVINIVGTFKGGYQQTVLMYYFQ